MIDLMKIQPSKISRNLRGKYLLVYGAPKIGKTTLLSQLPHSLILAFEPGTNALNGAMVQPILRWSDFKAVLRDLKKAEVKERFHFIGIDTADVAWEFCEKYICANNEVTSLTDIPWGKGSSLCKKEFGDVFREIATLGYGICFVSHEVEKKLKNEKGEEYIQLSPSLTKGPYEIVNKFVDIIGYIRNIKDNDGSIETSLFLRGTDGFLAGSRFKYIIEKVKFSYNNLVGAIQDAIDKQVELEGGNTTEDGNAFYTKAEDQRSFLEATEEAKSLWTRLITQDELNVERVLSIIEKIFGKKMKLSEATESQLDLLELVIADMRDM